MTMQVGMVGTDGILIASDTKWSNSPLLYNRGWAGGRHSYNSPKIKINHEKGIAISCARDMEFACLVADTIIAELDESHFVYPVPVMEAIGRRRLATAQAERNHAQFLVALMRPQTQLFLFQFATVNGEWGPLCQKMESWAIAGDNVNPAIYWPERYYEKRPIDELVSLAAYTVVAAGKLNNAAISGLEIVQIRASEIKRLSDDSIRQLELSANHWDMDFGHTLLAYGEQFTYAPDVIG